MATSTKVTIKSGDTLSGIAKKAGVSVQAIAAANPSVKDINKIYAGNTLTIPTALPKSTTPTIQTTTSQRTQDIATQNKYNEVLASKTPVVTPSGKTPVGGASATGTPAGGVPTAGQVPNTKAPAALTVTKYQDNGDGTTTNFLSDGSTSTVRYIKNKDGSLTAVEIGSGKAGETGILDSERDYTAKTRQQLQDLDVQKEQFDNRISQLMANNNSIFQSTVESIKATYANRRDQLKQSYQSLVGSRAKAGYQTDAFRYTPTHEEGLVTNDENNYVSDLGSLDAQEQGLLLQAATAKDAKDWDALQKSMTLYDSIQTKKADLLGKLLNVAQEQNKRIEAEQKIAREAAATPKSAGAATLAKNVAAVLAKEVKSMTQEAAVKYIEGKAASLGIDTDILRSAVIDQGVQNLKDAKSLAAGSGGGKQTESEKKASFLGQLNSAMTDTKAKINGAPVIDMNGFLTPAGYKHLVQVAYKNGIKKADFISQYSDKFYLDGIDAYGLTSKEKELLGL